MERQTSSLPSSQNSHHESFSPSLTHTDTTDVFIDPAFPRYEKNEDATLVVDAEPTSPLPESIPHIHKKILPIIPEMIKAVPEPLEGLKKFIETPVTIDEVPNKEAFMRNVFPWIVNALGEAGYDGQAIDGFLKKSIDHIDFTKSPEQYVVHINRIIQNICKQVLVEKHTITSIEQSTSTTPYTPAQDIRVEAALPIAIESRERIEEATVPTEKQTAVDAFQNKFNALIEQPFTSDLYDQFYLEIHTALRDRYDAVLLKAQANLTRYSNLYTPTPTEKVALQFLSTLKSQFVRMQATDSALGVTRAEIMNSLNRTDASIDEEAVKNFIQDYIDGTKNLFTNIDRLDEMISIAQGEEKPALGEAYRTQFESLRVEGNKVLTTLPTNHPLYNDFKIVVEKGISDLISAASVEKGGDKAVLERSSYFISLRDRIKAAILYIKAEQEFENFKNRQLQQVQNLEMSLAKPRESSSPETDIMKQRVLDNIAIIKKSLTSAGVLPDGVSMGALAAITLNHATEDFDEQKIHVKQVLGETNVFLEEINASPVRVSAADESIVREQESVVMPLTIETLRAPLRERTLQLRREIPEAVVSQSRFRYIRPLIKSARMGALALLALTFSSGQYKPSSQETGMLSLQALMGMNAPVSTDRTFAFDRGAIQEFLTISIATAAEENVLNILPVVSDEAPTNMSVPVEVVEGVILPTSESYSRTTLSPKMKIYGNADTVRVDPGIKFDVPNQSEQGTVYTAEDFHTHVYGDTFWDISEGESLAGTLPVMKQINPYFKQALIDRMRDRLNKNLELRERIGGFGATANDLVIGEKMNLKILNLEFILEAINAGYLQ